MTYVMIALGFAGLVGCYELATRMSWRTRHGIRLAVIVIGAGCTLVMLGEDRYALLALLVGCGLYRVCDTRAADWYADSRAHRPVGFGDIAAKNLDRMCICKSCSEVVK